MVNLHVEKTIDAPPETVFAWLADPVNLKSAPLIVASDWARDSPPPGLGAIRTGFAIGLWFREEIVAYDPPHSYTYLIVGSVPAFEHEGGTLTFTPEGAGTHVDWVSTYTHPVRGGGRAMELLSSKLLPWNFAAVLDGCAKALER